MDDPSRHTKLMYLWYIGSCILMSNNRGSSQKWYHQEIKDGERRRRLEPIFLCAVFLISLFECLFGYVMEYFVLS